MNVNSARCLELLDESPNSAAHPTLFNVPAARGLSSRDRQDRESRSSKKGTRDGRYGQLLHGMPLMEWRRRLQLASAVLSAFAASSASRMIRPSAENLIRLAEHGKLRLAVEHPRVAGGKNDGNVRVARLHGTGKQQAVGLTGNTTSEKMMLTARDWPSASSAAVACSTAMVR